MSMEKTREMLESLSEQTQEKTGLNLIAEERLRQIIEEGYTSKYDDRYDHNQLALAAACYCLPASVRSSHNFDLRGTTMRKSLWPWKDEYWKPSNDNRIRELVKAGALIAAEIDHLLRIQQNENTP